MRFGPTLKKEKNATNSDPEDCGDVYTLTVIKTETRRFISHHDMESLGVDWWQNQHSINRSA